MKRTIIVMCACLIVTTLEAQYDERDRFVSINPLRNGDGSFMKANNPLFYNNTSTDTSSAKRRVIPTGKTDPLAFRINSVNAYCQLNSLQLDWTTIQQQPDADRFEIEQSADAGANWTRIGIVPATRLKTGEETYHFTYNKSLGNVDLRIAAVNTAGERRYSSIIHSACSNNNLFSADNLVYSTAQVRIGSSRVENVKMLVTNQSGVVVLAKEAGLTQGVNSITVDMSSLPKGFYVLTVIWPGGRQESVKMMKQ